MTQVPEWLDLDKLVPPELVARIPEVMAEAQELCKAVERYLIAAGTLHDDLDKAIARTEPPSAVVDGWGRYIDQLIGFQDLLDLQEVAAGALEVLVESNAYPEYSAPNAARLLGQDAFVTRYLRAAAKKDDALLERVKLSDEDRARLEEPAPDYVDDYIARKAEAEGAQS